MHFKVCCCTKVSNINLDLNTYSNTAFLDCVAARAQCFTKNLNIQIYTLQTVTKFIISTDVYGSLGPAEYQCSCPQQTPGRGPKPCRASNSRWRYYRLYRRSATGNSCHSDPVSGRGMWQIIYHASDKIIGILLHRSWSHDAVKITVLGVEIRIGRVIEFEAEGKQFKMADDEFAAMGPSL